MLSSLRTLVFHSIKVTILNYFCEGHNYWVTLKLLFFRPLKIQELSVSCLKTKLNLCIFIKHFSTSQANVLLQTTVDFTCRLLFNACWFTVMSILHILSSMSAELIKSWVPELNSFSYFYLFCWEGRGVPRGSVTRLKHNSIS